MNSQQLEIPHVDARKQESITEEQGHFFRDNGFLVVRNVLQGEELRIVRDEMQILFDKGVAGAANDMDYAYSKGGKSGKQVLNRIEYVIDKSDPMKAMLAHPFILKSVELLQGRNFIPTWDSMVVKVPDEGIVVPWHRDSAVPEGCTDPHPIFNVDFYLDDADLKTCLWVIPGSNNWSDEQANLRIGQPGFDTSDAIPVPMQAGDIILHNIAVLHGSPAGDGNPQRRTVYYEFRPGEIQAEFGPHTLEYISLKQQVLLECIKRRKQTSYGAQEKAYEYRPYGAFAVAEERIPTTFRYPHHIYFRKK